MKKVLMLQSEYVKRILLQMLMNFFFFLSTVLLILLEMLKLAALLLEYDTGKKKGKIIIFVLKNFN